MNICDVCGKPCMSDQHCCGDRGPRIGGNESLPRCVLPPRHHGDHQAHESWNGADAGGDTPVTWTDLASAQRSYMELADQLVEAMADHTRFGIADHIINVLGVRAAETLIRELS